MGCANDQTLIQDRDMEAFVDTGHGDYWKHDDASGTLRCEGENRPSRPSNIIAGCLNPWDSQTARIYDGKSDSYHAVNANSGGGLNREGITMEQQLELKGDETKGAAIPPLKLTKTVRRILPSEAEVLMGFPKGHTIPCFKPEDITDELVDYFIEVFHTWDCMNMKQPRKKPDESAESNDAETSEETSEETEGCVESEAEGQPEGIDGDTETGSEAATLEAETSEPEKTEEEPKLPKRRSRKFVRAWLEQISNPKTCPDGPRYKCCGNAFGVNCVRWIGLGIQAVEDKYSEQQ